MLHSSTHAAQAGPPVSHLENRTSIEKFHRILNCLTWICERNILFFDFPSKMLGVHFIHTCIPWCNYCSFTQPFLVIAFMFRKVWKIFIHELLTVDDSMAKFEGDLVIFSPAMAVFYIPPRCLAILSVHSNIFDYISVTPGGLFEWWVPVWLIHTHKQTNRVQSGIYIQIN